MDGAKGQSGPAAGGASQAQQSGEGAKGRGESTPDAASRERSKDSDTARTKDADRKASDDRSRGDRTQDRARDDRERRDRDAAERRDDDDRRKGRAERDRDDDDRRKGQADRDDDRDRQGRAQRDRDDDRDRQDRAGRDRDDDRDDRDRADRDRGGDRDRVRLSSREETRVREVFSRTDIRRVNNVNFNIAVGVSVPRSVELYPLPPAVIEIVPQYRSYRYVAVDDEIIIVHPETFVIVEVITVSGSRQARGGGGARLEFTADQRRRIRTYALQECRTVIASPRFDLAVGVRIPDTYDLCPFEDAIVSDVQVVRPYRYVIVENEVVVIDPQTHTIVEVIR
jgi:hypothetical protein